ncbi:MAG: hypothetical protein LBU32_25740 [Clostridiales bacterium]|jgi:hypothetical protein|nr:hypothetical protein [Clostridiales bacterium]
MTEQEIQSHLMELEALLGHLKVKAREVIEKVDEGKPLPEPLILELSELIDGINRHEGLSISLFETLSIESSRFFGSTISEMRATLAQYFESQRNEEYLSAIRQVFSKYLHLCSDSEPVMVELKSRQSKVSSYTEEAMLALNYEEHVLPYETFTKYALQEDVVSIIQDLDKMIEQFGYVLATALIQKKIYIKPAELTESSDEKGSKPSIPACFSQHGIHPAYSDLSFGVLVRTSRKGGPKAASSLLKSLRKFEPIFVADAGAVSAFALKNAALSPELLLMPELAKIHRSKEDLLYAADFLLKEGFLIKYNLESNPDCCLYGISLAGSKILLQDSCRRKLFAGGEQEISVESELESAADFARHKESCDAAEKLKAVGEDSFSFIIGSFKRFSFAVGRFGSINFGFIPMIFSVDDDLSSFPAFLENISSQGIPSLRLVISSSTMEEASNWISLLKAEMNPSFIKSAFLYFGQLSIDKFITPEGEETTLVGCLTSNPPVSSEVEPQAAIEDSASSKKGLRQGAISRAKPMPEASKESPGSTLVAEYEKALSHSEPEPIEEPDAAKPKPAKAISAPLKPGPDKPEPKNPDMESLKHPIPGKKETARPQRQKEAPAKNGNIAEETVQLTFHDEKKLVLHPSISLASALSSQILLHNPGSSDEVDFSPVIISLLKGRHCMEAVVLAKTVASSSSKPKNDFILNALLKASNIALSPSNYSSETLRFFFRDDLTLLEEEALLTDYSRVAAYAWALAFPTLPFDHDLYNTPSQDILSGIPTQLSDAIEPILALLTKDLKAISFNSDGQGFSQPILNALRTNSEKRTLIKDICKKAEEVYNVTRFSKFTGSDDFQRETFGPNSKLGKCIGLIKDGDMSKNDFIADVYSRFDSHEEGGYPWLMQMNAYIDEQWEIVKQNNSNIRIDRLDNGNITGLARRRFSSEISKRVDIISQWLQLCKPSDAILSSRLIENFKRLKSDAISLIDKFIGCVEGFLTADSASDSHAAGASLAMKAFEGIKNRLNASEEINSKWIFIPLLSTPFMHLDERFLPSINPSMNEIQGMEPWRLMLRHISTDKTPPEKVIELIEKDKDTDWYDDYGTAVILNQYLSETGKHTVVDFTDQIKAASEDAKIAAEDFEKSIRLAYAYGKLDMDVKETIFKIFNNFKPYFEKSLNFASFRKFLQILEAKSKMEIAERRRTFEKELCELAENENIKSDVPMLSYINQALDSENFALAEEYRTRLMTGETDLTEEERKAESEMDYHQAFLQSYELYYKECGKEEHRGRNPSAWAYRVLSERLKNSWSSTNESRQAESFLSSWILQKNLSNAPATIKKFLTYLGFRVEGVEKRIEFKDDNFDVFKAAVKPLGSGLKDYEHPVFKYGTALGDSINVVCLFGSKGASTIIQIITRQLQMNGPTIVLMDGALTLFERGSVAKEFKSRTSGQNSFLLIDRILLLYLGTLNVGNRMVAMLRCTLPYTFEQLFSTGVGAVNDEMFIGRIAERNEICNDTGPCLVYGARQLGKTALLRRARNIQHQPQNKMYAVYKDIKDKNAEEMIEELKREMSLIGFEISGQTLEDVCGELRMLYERGAISRLQVFLDETDSFFEDIAKSGYSLLHCFVQLMRETNQKIKFVFAGLHNVAHTHSATKNNSELGQFSKSICISPLSSKDARLLIERPLSYLGFKIGEHEMALILANTNSYPGLLHLFCSTLVQSACENYNKYYSADKNPPYELTDEQLMDIFSSGGIEDALREKVKSTLIDLDDRYKLIANLIAYLTREDRKNGENNLYGYSPETIREVITIPCLQALDAGDFKVLLSEMVDMGILWSKPNSGLYRLRNEKFLEIIGTEDEVLYVLLSASPSKVGDPA